MGRQINFFLHQDDQAGFDELLKNFGDVVLLPYYHYDNKVSTVKDTLIRDIREEGSRVYLIRKQDFQGVRLRHIENFGYWLIDDNALPVIHFDRGETTDGAIKSGRLYFTTDYVDATKMVMVKKPEDFIKWADNIIKTVRRKLIKQKYKLGVYTYTEYLGQHASKWKEFNRAEIA
ncbi:MAG TPA: hypothetical protein VEA37_00120, partial [Flavobacterium sp.]|nr:hypothetical protein [Flavobacterium sp.]